MDAVVVVVLVLVLPLFVVAVDVVATSRFLFASRDLFPFICQSGRNEVFVHPSVKRGPFVNWSLFRSFRRSGSVLLIILNTSAVTSISLGAIVIFASSVMHRPLAFTHVVSFEYV